MVKRKFADIRNLLLLQLAKGKTTINNLSGISGVNWKTAENHLTFLIGKGLAREVFSSPYARIFEITEKGKEVVEQINPKGILKFVKKDEGTRILII